MSETKTKTLKQWQKLYPDAIRVKAKANTFLSDEYLRKMVDKDGKAKILQDTSYGSWSSGKGNTVYVNVIISKQAYTEKSDV